MESDYKESIKREFEKEKSKYIGEIESLKQKLEGIYEVSMEYEEQKQKLKHLYESGIIDENFNAVNDMQ